MTKKELMQRKALDFVLRRLLRYVDKDPQRNILRVLKIAGKLAGSTFPKKNLEAMQRTVASGEGAYYQFALNILRDTDRAYLRKLILALALGAGLHGTRAVRANREVYHCNIPFLILMDPTSACNCHCKGCWAAEYGHKNSLTFEEMNSVVTQGKALGTHVYMFTGGEPLLRKRDLIRLCEAHPDCAFLAYTNATLIDEAFCDELLRVGNMTLAISIEGTQKTTDARRGEGMYDAAVRAMELLRRKGVLFGMSVCYTRENVEMVTGDAFLDKMVALGVKFGFYFNYMPVGQNAPAELIPTPEQRAFMYRWLRKTRNNATGKSLFVMDFQDDGEFVGGCIAGGRNYFHINAAGDMEPCVFIHFSDSNIREKTLLEGLKSDLFMAYYHNQPFNDNHLRPCPMLENPQCLRKIIAETGAKSTNLEGEETADSLCSKCDRFAAAWAPVAQKLWDTTPHPHPKTQFYRDTPEGRAAAENAK